MYANQFDENVDIYEEDVFLIEWHPHQPDQTTIIRHETDVRTGAPRFVSSMENAIIYWKRIPPYDASNGALYRYDIETGIETLLWEPMLDVSPASFSPDGAWGVFIDDDSRLYLLSIHNLIADND